MVQSLLCGNSSEKVPYYRATGLAYRGKDGQNTGTAFFALRLGVVPYLLIAHGVLTLDRPQKRCVNLLHRKELLVADLEGPVRANQAIRSNRPRAPDSEVNPFFANRVSGH